MAITCPHCRTRIRFTLKLISGPIFSSRGVQIHGFLDDAKAEAHAVEDSMYAHHQLRGYPYAIALCEECRKEFVVENPGALSPRVVWPLPGIDIADHIPEDVARPLIDAKKAHSVGAEIAALLAARTALVRMQRQQEISKLDGLIDKGAITRCWPGRRTK